MAAGGARDTAIRYVDEAGEASLTTAADVDLKRAARSAPGWRRQGAPGTQRPDAVDAHGWTRGAAHLPTDHRVDPGRLWVAAFDPVERWIVARPMLGLDLGALRRLVGEPGPRATEPAPVAASSRVRPAQVDDRALPCPTEAPPALRRARLNPCQLGAAWVGSLLHATADGLEAVSRKLRNPSSWAW